MNHQPPSEVRIFYPRSPPPVPGPGSLAGRRVLFALAPSGHVVQETLLPARTLFDAGAEVVFATVDGSEVRFDPAGNALAVFEALYSPALSLLWSGSREGRLSGLLDLRALERAGELEDRLAGFDAVVVPGGHGGVFGRFVADPLLARVLVWMEAHERVLGILCHAVAAGSWALRSDGSTLLAGRHVTCWPRSMERVFGLGGRYFVPFGRWVQDLVVESGAIVHADGAPWRLPTAVVDGPWVTSWGPWTAEPFARALALRLGARVDEEAEPPSGGEVGGRRRRRFRNWAGNFACRPERFISPSSEREVACEIARAARDGRSVRPVGRGYSYTRLVQTDEVMISLERISGIMGFDEQRGVVRVGAGTCLGDLSRALFARGWAIPTMGDIDRQSLAGAIATGTHGTGMRWASLSSLVTAVTFVDGRGQIHTLSEDEPEALAAARVGLGALGVVTSVDLRVVPAYHLEVHRWGSTLDQMIEEFPRRIAENRTFEFFWFPGTRVVNARRMNEVAPSRSSRNRAVRFVNELVVENGLGWAGSVAVSAAPGSRRVLEQLAPHLFSDEIDVRPAHEAFATPRLVRHYEIEYGLPLEHARAALEALDQMVRRHPVDTIFPIEVRFSPAEDALLSPAYRRDTVWIAAHTWIHEDPSDYFDRCEAIFLSFQGRPHWGKMHSQTAAQLAPKYPGWDAFSSARRRYDPDGRFQSPYLERVLGPTR